MSECTCRVCINRRRWLTAIDPQTPAAKAALDEILTNLEGAETDSTYWRMKFQNTWNRPDPPMTGNLDCLKPCECVGSICVQQSTPRMMRANTYCHMARALGYEANTGVKQS